MKHWLMIVFFMQLLGCAQVRTLAVPAYVDTSKPHNVIIARKQKAFGSAQLYYVVLDDKKIAGLFPGERVELHLKAGEYQIGAGCVGGPFLSSELGRQESVSIDESSVNVFTIGPSLLRGCSFQSVSLNELSEKQLSPDSLIPIGAISTCGARAKEKVICFRKARLP